MTPTHRQQAQLVQGRLVDAALIGQADPELYLDASEAIVALLAQDAERAKQVEYLDGIISNLRHEIAHLRSVEASY